MENSQRTTSIQLRIEKSGIIWVVVDAHLINLIVGLSVLFVGGLPTIIRAWQNPANEDLMFWVTFLVASVLAVVRDFSMPWTGLIFALYYVVFEFLMTGLVLRKYFIIKNNTPLPRFQSK